MADGDRRPASRVHRSWSRGIPLSAAALLALAVIVLHDDYGITWDEGVQAAYGEMALDYFASGGEDGRARSYLNLNYYGPAYEMAAAAVYRELGSDRFETRHLLIGLLALLGLPAVFLFGRRLDGPLTGALAVVALVAMPRFVGHAFNNSKDLPLAIAVAWFMLATTHLLVDRDFRWRWILATGAAFGAALWARPGAFPLLAAWLVIARVAGILWGEESAAAVRPHRSPSAGTAASVVLGLGWLLMVLPWPWAHENPAVNPILAMSSAARFPIELPVLFDGQRYPLAQIPRRYALQYLLITTPPGLLALGGVGALWGSYRAVRAPRGSGRARTILLLSWVAVPIAVVTVLRPHLYDGIRHLLFVLPGMALLVGLGGAWILRRQEGALRGMAALTAVLLLLLGALPSMMRLHPYQTTYFNAFVGGTAGAEGRYELDYWAASYTEAMRWINRQVVASARPVTVLVAGSAFLEPAMRHLAAPGVRPIVGDSATLASHADAPYYYLALRRWGLERAFPTAPVVHRVGRGGATFAVVKRVDGASEAGDPRRERGPGP